MAARLYMRRCWCDFQIEGLVLVYHPFESVEADGKVVRRVSTEWVRRGLRLAAKDICLMPLLAVSGTLAVAREDGCVEVIYVRTDLNRVSRAAKRRLSMACIGLTSMSVWSHPEGWFW